MKNDVFQFIASKLMSYVIIRPFNIAFNKLLSREWACRRHVSRSNLRT